MNVQFIILILHWDITPPKYPKTFVVKKGVVDNSTEIHFSCKNLADQSKPWILSPHPKPFRQIWQEVLGEYQASLASHGPVLFVNFD